jgi:hypothetical protein
MQTHSSYSQIFKHFSLKNIFLHNLSQKHARPQTAKGLLLSNL